MLPMMRVLVFRLLWLLCVVSNLAGRSDALSVATAETARQFKEARAAFLHEVSDQKAAIQVLRNITNTSAITRCPGECCDEIEGCPYIMLKGLCNYVTGCQKSCGQCPIGLLHRNDLLEEGMLLPNGSYLPNGTFLKDLQMVNVTSIPARALLLQMIAQEQVYLFERLRLMSGELNATEVRVNISKAAEKENIAAAMDTQSRTQAIEESVKSAIESSKLIDRVHKSINSCDEGWRLDLGMYNSSNLSGVPLNMSHVYNISGPCNQTGWTDGPEFKPLVDGVNKLNATLKEINMNIFTASEVNNVAQGVDSNMKNLNRIRPALERVNSHLRGVEWRQVGGIPVAIKRAVAKGAQYMMGDVSRLLVTQVPR